MGHYTGLMHFGREVMGTNNLPVYAMPKMKTLWRRCWRPIGKFRKH